MATVPPQVRIDENLKKQASELFSQLGMDMSGAMNIFLKQCVLRGGLPFSVELPQYKPEVLEAMEEAKRISKTLIQRDTLAFQRLWRILINAI